MSDGESNALSAGPQQVPSTEPQQVDHQKPEQVNATDGLTPAWLSEFETKHGKVNSKYVRPTEVETLAEISKAHAALESKLAGRQEQQQQQPATPPPAEAAKIESLSKAVEKAGLSAESLIEQYQTSGMLTDAQYVALEGAGWTRDAVNESADGMVAKAKLANQERQTVVNQAYEIAGGTKEHYDALATFVVDNYTDAERAAYNEAVGGSPEMAAMAVRAAAARRAEKQGTAGSVPLVAGGQPGGGGDTFASDAEVQSFIAQHPDLYTNASKRNDFMNKMARSKKLLGG